MSNHNSIFNDSDRRAEIDALRNAARDPFSARLVKVVEEIYRDQVVEKKRRKAVEQELAALKRERVAA